LRKRSLDGVNLLDLRPVRVATWREEGERVVVERTLPPARGLRGVLKRLSFLTGVKYLRLDELGTAVWHRLDGSRTVAEICAAVREEFGESCEPAEGRLGIFLGMLRREGLIGYPGWDDAEIEAAKQRPEAGATSA